MRRNLKTNTLATKWAERAMNRKVEEVIRRALANAGSAGSTMSQQADSVPDRCVAVI